MQVGYNIAGPALNQLANITEKREGGVRGVRKAFGVKKRAAAAGIAGLSAASLLAAPQADAATEAFQLAAGACMAREERVNAVSEWLGSLRLLCAGFAVGWLSWLKVYCWVALASMRAALIQPPTDCMHGGGQSNVSYTSLILGWEGCLLCGNVSGVHIVIVHSCRQKGMCGRGRAWTMLKARVCAQATTGWQSLPRSSCPSLAGCAP